MNRVFNECCLCSAENVACSQMLKTVYRLCNTLDNMAMYLVQKSMRFSIVKLHLNLFTKYIIRYNFFLLRSLDFDCQYYSNGIHVTVSNSKVKISSLSIVHRNGKKRSRKHLTSFICLSALSRNATLPCFQAAAVYSRRPSAKEL